jgi:hypothetical protein
LYHSYLVCSQIASLTVQHFILNLLGKVDPHCNYVNRRFVIVQQKTALDIDAEQTDSIILENEGFRVPS